MGKRYNGPLFRKQLVYAVTAQTELHDGDFSDEDGERLLHSFTAINPVTHSEAVAALALGLRGPAGTGELIGEYIRRKNSIVPADPYFSIFSLKYWGVPYTYGLLLYREQVWAALRELFAINIEEAHKIEKKFLKREFDFDRFSVELTGDYRALQKNEKKDIYETISGSVEHAQFYFWCSTMVERAEEVFR